LNIKPFVLLVILTFAFLLRAAIPQVATGTWQAGNAMTEARSGSAAVPLADGSVLITGGDGTSGPLNTAELMSSVGTFSSVAPMQSPRSNHAAIVLQDGRVLVTGGTTPGGGITNSAELYDPTTQSWTTANSAMIAPRSGHTASLLPDGTVLLAGGSNSAGPVPMLEIFDPSSDSFSSAGMLTSPVSKHAAATLADGRVFIAGGS
jgi:N-acetylneuraminic acid mutarotase